MAEFEKTVARELNKMTPENRLAVLDCLMGLLNFCPECGWDYSDERRECYCMRDD